MDRGKRLVLMALEKSNADPYEFSNEDDMSDCFSTYISPSTLSDVDSTYLHLDKKLSIDTTSTEEKENLAQPQVENQHSKDTDGFPREILYLEMPRNDKVYNYLQSLENFMPSNEFNNNSPANSTQVMNTDCHNIKDNENQVSEASCHIPHKPTQATVHNTSEETNHNENNLSTSYDLSSGNEYVPSIINTSKSSGSSGNDSADIEIPPAKSIQVTVDDKYSELSFNLKKNQKAFCTFCFEEVTHFARHLFRKHHDEICVKKIQSLPIKSNERRSAILALRKKGSFLLMQQKNVLNPVRLPNKRYKTNSQNTLNPDNYLPCVYCLGCYAKSYLWRHRKICKSKPETTVVSRYHSSESHTLLVSTGMLGNYLNKSRLKNEVLNIMRVDEISHAAKTDALICLYGESHLSKHKRVQMNVSISNKMREMARLKLTLKQTMTFENLIEVLKPEIYQQILVAVKIISGFDPITKKFKAASLALHMGTDLQFLCSIAKKALITKDPLFGKLSQSDIDKQAKEIESLSEIIKTHWCHDVSSLANKILNENISDKPKLIPLTEDVKIFNKYVLSLANKSFNALRSGNDIQVNYKNLVECTMALTLVFNRKRIGEVQFLEIVNYEKESTNRSQEECLSVLSPLERAMCTSFKRVVVFGKGSKSVPILFTQQMQVFITELLRIRRTTKIVPGENKYVFANPGSLNRWMNGYAVLRKLAMNSGAKNPHLLTSTRFRKQIATILQLMNFEKYEIEQMARFMGHTEKTHLDFYRLSEDTYQTAKVVKVLLLMNAGRGAEFQGKKLEDIELNENDLCFEAKEDNCKTASAPEDFDVTDNEDKMNIRNHSIPDTNLHNASSSKSYHPEEISVKPKSKRLNWTSDQKKTVLKYFENHIKNKRLPKKTECLAFMKKESKIFQGVNWSRIKVLVYNTYRSQ